MGQLFLAPNLSPSKAPKTSRFSPIPLQGVWKLPGISWEVWKLPRIRGILPWQLQRTAIPVSSFLSQNRPVQPHSVCLESSQDPGSPGVLGIRMDWDWDGLGETGEVGARGGS